MAIFVNITKGFYRTELVTGIFPLVQPYKVGARGGTVKIRNPNPKQGTPPVQSIIVDEGDFTIVDKNGNPIEDHVTLDFSNKTGQVEAGTNYEQAFIANETDEDAMVRIAETFEMLDKITDACAKGVVRGLVVSGPPGIGKSFGVEKQLISANMFRTIKGQDPMFEIISGGISGIGLYQKLYYNRTPEQVIVFDDCDGIFTEEEPLNLLKAALNSSDRRRICWNKESRTLLNGDIPDAFDFEGSIIFLTNVDFERTIAKDTRISCHLAAMMSRCHYLDLEISSTRDKLLRIKQIVQNGMLSSYAFTPAEQAQIISFIVGNAEYLREISLRMVKKVADLVKSDPLGWYKLAEATCLQKEARFKRLLAKQKEASKSGLVLIEA